MLVLVFFTVYSQVIFSLKRRILQHSCLKVEKKQRSESCKHHNTVCNMLGREDRGA